MVELQLFEILESEGANIVNLLRKSTLKVVQMKSLAIHITNQKISFDWFKKNL